MLVNVRHDTPAEHRRLVYAGLAFMAAAAVLIAFSIAIYQKVFTPVTMVTVKADRAGLQLPKFGDVRIHGVLVGQVRSVSQDGHEAVIKLGLQPSAARSIPDNVSVEIRPTTLFGQKYVSLVDPASPSRTPRLRRSSRLPDQPEVLEHGVRGVLLLPDERLEVVTGLEGVGPAVDLECLLPLG